MVYPSGKSPVSGRHEFWKGASVLVNDAVPLDDRLMPVNVWSYSV